MRSETITVAVFGFDLVSVVRGEYIERPVIGCIFESGYMLAGDVAVNIVRAGAGHQVFGHVVDGDCMVLVDVIGAFAI
jgi:hypothetical protein